MIFLQLPTMLQETTHADKSSWKKCKWQSWHHVWVNTIPSNLIVFKTVPDNHVLMVSFCECNLIDTSGFLFRPTRMARSLWKSKLQLSEGVCRNEFHIFFLMLHCAFLSIYKMFPADKKRVETSLASANLPKGKVRNDIFGLFSCHFEMSVFLLFLPFIIQ